MKERDQVYVEDKADEVDMQAQNVMGSGSAISQKQLTDLYAQLKELQKSNAESKKDLSLQAGQMKQQIAKLREEKVAAEKRLFDSEFRVGELETMLETAKQEREETIEKQEVQINELAEKLSWFRENQKLLDADEKMTRDNFNRI